MADNLALKCHPDATIETMRKWLEVVRRFDETEQGFLLDELKEHQAGNVSIEVSVARFEARVMEYRASGKA